MKWCIDQKWDVFLLSEMYYPNNDTREKEDASYIQIKRECLYQRMFTAYGKLIIEHGAQVIE